MKLELINPPHLSQIKYKNVLPFGSTRVPTHDNWLNHVAHLCLVLCVLVFFAFVLCFVSNVSVNIFLLINAYEYSTTI